jgi:hypothetical protein
MSGKDNFLKILEEIKEIYIFLTEKEPTPDDEIEARDVLIGYFKELVNLSQDDINKELISEINSDLKEWDTLDLWFSETKIPNKMGLLLKLPYEPDLSPKPSLESEKKSKTEESDIDLTDIFNKVSEQFQGEIDNLKGKIEDLKKQLEKKDEKLRIAIDKKKIQKISPKREVRLPPPKIKIPVIKKSIQASQSISSEKPFIVKTTKAPETQAAISPKKPNIASEKVNKEELSPIPLKSEIEVSEPKKPIEQPSPKPKLSIEPIVIEEDKDVPIITEKIRKTSAFSDMGSKNDVEIKEKVSPFSVEKPKITSVSVEEIEHESIKSSSSDLFNVFSSIGTKGSEKTEQLPQEDTKDAFTNIQSKEPEILNETQNTKSFVNFNERVSNVQTKEIASPQKDLTNDKDSLYQELIALEGKRYAIEKSFKDLDRNYGKGSIADSSYKTQSEKLKAQMDEITSRINSIRRLISSL